MRPASKIWKSWWSGDQGQTNECVGFSFYNLMRALPNVQHEPGPHEIYHAAQENDEFPGTGYEGSSVRGGAKALKKFGRLTAYVWAFDVETMIDWIALKGPCVLGINWTKGMMSPDQFGLIAPDGPIVGGHAILAQGFDDRKKLLLLKNSWSKNWGVNGRCWISYEDIDGLIKNDGECCAPTESTLKNIGITI